MGVKKIKVHTFSESLNAKSIFWNDYRYAIRSSYVNPNF